MDFVSLGWFEEVQGGLNQEATVVQDVFLCNEIKEIEWSKWSVKLNLTMNTWWRYSGTLVWSDRHKVC